MTMKPVTYQKLAQLRKMMAHHQRRGINVTLTGTTLTVTNPVGGTYSADLQATPNVSADSFLAITLNKSFKSYVLGQIAPPEYRLHGQHHEYSWRDGAYTIVAFIGTWAGIGRVTLHAFDVEAAGETELRSVVEGSHSVASYESWPQPVELRRLLANAIESWQRFRRFEAFLTKEKIEYQLTSYRVFVAPLSISFANGQPSLKFFEGQTSLVGRSREVHEIVERFMAADTSRAVSTDPSPDTSAEISLDLV